MANIHSTKLPNNVQTDPKLEENVYKLMNAFP